MRGFLIGLLLIAALFGVGYYLGWFEIGSSTAGDDKEKKFSVTFNAGKAKEDLRAAKDKITGKSVEGAIRTIDPAQSLVGIEASAGKDEVMLQVNGDTKIKLDGEPAKLGDLKAGDRARASYVVRDAANVAESLTVTRK